MSLLKLAPLFPLEEFVEAAPLTSRINTSTSSYDLVDNDEVFKLDLDVPGMKQSDLELTFHEGVIRVAGLRRKVSADGKTVKKIRLDRSFRVDTQTIDVSQIKANLADGVLTISAPKKKKPEPVTIMISTQEDKSEETKNVAVNEKKDDEENAPPKEEKKSTRGKK